MDSDKHFVDKKNCLGIYLLKLSRPISFKFATNFLYTYSKKPAKDRGRGCTGLAATPTVLKLMAHPVDKSSL